MHLDIAPDQSALGSSASEHTGKAEPGVAVSVRNLSKVYSTQFPRLKQLFGVRVKPPVQALRNVSFEIYRGEVFGLIGRNGAGKTTLAKSVATLVQPSSGHITVNGFDSVRDEVTVRSQIGLASAEERSFYWRLTAYENMLFFARLYGMTDENSFRRIDELFTQLELHEVTRRRFGEMSTGNKQRLAIARALLANPPVILLDEPTRSLDPFASANMRSFIASLSRASSPATIFLTSHNLAEIEELCSRVAIISKGEIRAVDTPERLKEQFKSSEQVTISLRGLSRTAAVQLVTRITLQFEVTATASGLLLQIIRDTNDSVLDAVLRELLTSGAEILSVDTQRGTLHDVLEHFERREDNPNS